nr:hypothetical protein [Tanacetum cinerariifolium]
MMNEVDIENLTNEQYLMLTQESQTQGMVRSEFGRMITKDIEDMTIVEYMETSEIQGVSFIAKEEERESLETLPCKKQSNEINPGGFTLPYTISNLKIYDMADVGAGINMMPKSLFKHLKLINLKKTSMVVEMADTTKKAPLGIVENIPKGEYFNPPEVEKNDSFVLEQRTLHYSEERIDTVDSSDDSQEDEVGSHLSEDVVSRWHVCKPVHVTFKDKGYVEEELWQNGMEEMNYTHPLVKSETFEVHQYTFKNRKSFISITKQIEDILTLGRVNGSRFIEKTRREMDEEEGATRKM